VRFAVFISCLKLLFCFASDIISTTNGVVLLLEVALVVVIAVAVAVAEEEEKDWLCFQQMIEAIKNIIESIILFFSPIDLSNVLLNYDIPK
jgi:hypothetical protein